jgi:hypothetical protein
MAKFSKAHYVILAGVFREAAETDADLGGLYICRLLLMEKLATDNPKFDQERFLKASNPTECPNPNVCGCKSTLGAKQ